MNENVPLIHELFLIGYKGFGRDVFKIILSSKI